MDQRTELAALRIAANKLLQACEVVPKGSLSAEFVRETFKESLPEAATALQSSGGEVRLRVDRDWSDYPIGTKAHAVMGGYWIRVQHGWKWFNGSTFPTPGGDACGACIELPKPAASPAQPSGFVLVPVELLERITRDAMPATNSGYTCFVPRYQIDELRGLLTAAPAPIEQEG